jgi:uncharacterized membrane protein
MGLRKLTQWEETVAKQEQKQFRLMSVAIVCVIAMCVVLWLVQDKLYGDVVNTGTGAYISSAIGVGLGLLMRSAYFGILPDWATIRGSLSSNLLPHCLR